VANGRVTSSGTTLGCAKANWRKLRATVRSWPAQFGSVAAQAAGLQHQAQARRTDAATARGEVNQEFERAAKMDPDSQASDTPRKGPKRAVRLEDPPPESRAHHRCPEPDAGLGRGRWNAV